MGAVMAVDTEAIAGEIRSLRKGRGVNAADLAHRLGPHLRELVVTSPATDTVERHALVAQLGSCAAGLAADVRIAVAASLGLSAETRQMPYFGDRIAWLATWLGREYRTALRRVDTAERLLAEEIARELARRRGRATAETGDWYLEELRTVVRVDVPGMEALEQRRIVAVRDGLREVMAWLDVPSAVPGGRAALSGEVLYGGRLVRREQPSPGRFRFMVRLPAALAAGEAHEYAMVLRVPADQPFRPHYIFTPECRCDAFDLRVRFDTDRPPRWVRSVRDETVRTFDAVRSPAETLDLDEAGEVHLRFPRPARYLGHGVQWQP